MATTFKQVKNNAFSTLSGAINAAVTALAVQTGHGTRFPATASGAFWATIWKATSYTDPFDDPNLEIVLINTRVTDSFSSITRGQLGTTAHAHEDGDKIALLMVDQSLIDIHTAINTAETTLAGLPTAANIVTLTGSQILTNKTLTAPIFGGTGVIFNGSTSGTTTLKATAIAGTTTLTLPAATDTLVGKTTTDILTNKTLTGGLVTADPSAALGIASKQYVDNQAATTSLVQNEVPGGSVNGSNTAFTTASAFATGSLRVYRNGIRLKGGGADYTAGSSAFTMVTAPLTGDVLLVDYNVSATGFSVGTNSTIFNETPAGSVNGSNTLFTLARAYISGSLQVYVDGILQRITTDFTETTPGSGTFTFVTAPVTGQSVRVHYQYNLNPSGNSDTVDGIHASATPVASQLLALDSNARFDQSALPLGAVVQFQSSLASAVATGTTLIPIDDTIPQNTEGDQYLTVSITPKSATNILVVQVIAMLANTAVTPYIAGALFQDSIANALAAAVGRTATASDPLMLALTHTMVAGTTSAMALKFRGGGGGAGTTTFNGQVAGRFFGAITKSSILVTEYKA